MVGFTPGNGHSYTPLVQPLAASRLDRRRQVVPPIMKAFIGGANLVAKLRRAGVLQMTTRAHIEPSCISGVVDVTKSIDGLVGHPFGGIPWIPQNAIS